jgi:hypothetical protein
MGKKILKKKKIGKIVGVIDYGEKNIFIYLLLPHTRLFSVSESVAQTHF